VISSPRDTALSDDLVDQARGIGGTFDQPLTHRR
jgi:hypothetical protein